MESLADFMAAVADGADLWGGTPGGCITWCTYESGSKEYAVLEGLGWSTGTDYGAYGSTQVYVYSPYPPVADVDTGP